jgi:hypothetical protein
MTERRERKPSPPPKTPALVRRGVVALAVGLGLSGAACGEVVGDDSQPPQPAPSPKGDAGAKGMGGIGGNSFDEAGFGEEESSPLDASPGDAVDDVEWLPPLTRIPDAGMDAPGEADSDQDVRIIPPLPPPPLPPPPLPPPPLPPR